MKLFIAEDEPPARERLVEAIGRVAPGSIVLGTGDTVAGTAAWLARHPPGSAGAPDLLLLDIQLADGLSLELFAPERAPVRLPVIFTTAYDRFALQAFQALAVDYLLKPVADDALAQAFAKAGALREHFAADVARWLAARQPSVAEAASAPAPATPASRQRLLGRPLAGTAAASTLHALPLAQVACVVALDKQSVAVTFDGARFALDAPLADVAALLDATRFFRINRQVVVAAAAVQHCSPAGKGRLALALVPEAERIAGAAVVPQERAAAFKAWWVQAPG